MREYFSTEAKQREKIIKKIQQTLESKKGVVFAYIFGSFLDAPSFRDIDIGIYAEGPILDKKIFDYELNLSEEIAKKSSLSFGIIEVKILNSAPDYFLNNVFSKGRLLFSKNQKLLADLIENSSEKALLNEFISRQSLKELIPV